MTAIAITPNEFGLHLDAIETRMDCRIQNIESNVKHITDKIDDLQSDISDLQVAVDIQKTDSVIIKTEINNLKDNLKEHFATKVELKDAVGAIRADMGAMETRLIKWMISTGLASIALATSIGFGLAKFVAT